MMIAYQRQGRFGAEFLIPMDYLPIISNKETDKTFCCGVYSGGYYKDGTPHTTVYGYIPKSQIVDVNGERLVPAWILDKWNITHLQFTQWINSDYYHRTWIIKEM